MVIIIISNLWDCIVSELKSCTRKALNRKVKSQRMKKTDQENINEKICYSYIHFKWRGENITKDNGGH